MARINVEDDFWTHPRYRALTRIIGDEDKAAGMCIRFWRLAQSYWGHRKPVPLDVWDLEKLEPLVDVGLADRRADGVYCRNSEKHFEWYSQRVEAGRRGGLKSVRSRAEKYGTAQPRGTKSSKQTRSTASTNTEAPPKQTRSTAPEAPKPLTLYEAEKPEVQLKGGDVWEAYRASYFARYSVEPVRNAESNTHCSNLVKKLGGDAAVAVVRFYLTHGKRYYVENCHSLRACAYDAAALHTQMLTGKKVTTAQAVEGDRQASNAEAMKEAVRMLEARDAKK